MSQAGMNNASGGPSPPDVPTSFDTDDYPEFTTLTAIPALNILNVNGTERPDPLVIPDKDEGIQTWANPDLSNNLGIYLTNRRVDAASITGAGTVDLFTQDLGGDPGVYNFQLYVAAFNASTPSGAAYTIFGSVRTTGAAATVIVTQDIISDEEPALLGADFQIVASGNNLIARATGVAGLTINFKVLAQYVFVGA
jgi:hypothetical protein